MTKETIQSTDGKIYEIEYDRYISPEYRLQILGQLGHSMYIQNSDILSSRIVGLAPTCTTTTKTVGQIVTLTSKPTGQGPFTIIYKKDGVQIGTTQIVPVSGIAIYNYTTVATDAITGTPIGTHIFSVITQGSCVGSVSCTESCSVTIIEPVVTICSWITGKGGLTGIIVPNIFELVDAYIGMINIGFFPTVPEIMGCVDYYIGFIDSGNMKTGCVF